MPKIILIKGPQGSGKTQKAYELIGKSSYISADVSNLLQVLRNYSRAFIFADTLNSTGVKRAAKIYNDFYGGQIAEQENPTLIICTQDLTAEIAGAEVITM